MEHGPPVYRDLQSDEMVLLASFDVRTVFPDDVRAEADGLPADPRGSDLAGREDLRDRDIFTIDGDDARDYDDAIGIRALSRGNVELGVHIADVGHYVRAGSALDAEARARGTSIYLPDQVIPMLPERLSNGLCSLVPDRDRLAHSVIMEFAPDGTRVAARVCKSVIRSVRRSTYQGVQDLLDGRRTRETSTLRRLQTQLELLREWTSVQQEIRASRGALSVPADTRRFVFDDRHRVTAIVGEPRLFSQTLIEETALAANQAVGDLFHERGLPAVYRVHREKARDEIEPVARALGECGIRVPDKEHLTGRDITRMILMARRQPNAAGLIKRIMGLIERAVYEVRDSQDPARHYGLARRAYLHFTSPIRRYPDLLVHRWLHAIESEAAAASRLRAADLLRELNELAAHSSTRAEVAEMAQRAVADLKTCELMSRHVGEQHGAEIVRVSTPGIELDLTGFNVSGFLPTRTLGDRPRVAGSTLEVRSGGRRQRFSEGDRIAVRIREVDFVRLQVLLDPVSGSAPH